MNEAQDILSRCQALGAEFFPTADGKWKVRAPAPLPEELRSELKRCKPEVLRLLTQVAAFPCPACGGTIQLEPPEPDELPTRLWTCPGCQTWGAVRDGARMPTVWVGSGARQ